MHDTSRPRTPPVLRVGLTGGIAAGKSVASRRLVELGVAVIDHDLLARQAVAPGTDGLAEIVGAFGAGMLTADGSLDRLALGALVFEDQDARARLNGIVHPRVKAAAHDREAAAVAGGARIVVHDIPLLVETGQAGRFDEVVVVDAPAAVRAARLVGGRGLTADEAAARLDAQAGDAERRAVADRLLDGSGSPAGLAAQVDALVEAWRGVRNREGR